MDLISIVLIAIALSMDAFAVSLAIGMVNKEYAIKLPLSFGIFQAFMPIFGWLIGIEIKEMISSFDHWIAFFILSAIGLKMIFEAEEFEINAHSILILSIATSIDAFAIGITLSILNISIFFPALIIGLITFIICFIGFLIAGKIKFDKAEIIGGIILIFLGLKILYEHLHG